MLEQQQKDTGSASSLIGGFAMIMGSIGIFIVSFNWFRSFKCVVGLICGLAWKLVYKKPYIRHFPEIDMEHYDVAK